VCYPALPCKLAVVVIHRMLWWKKVCYPCAACMQAAAVIQNAPGCAIPALPCKLAAVVIHRMLWWKVCYPCAAMQARCCCDLTECPGGRRVCHPCAAMQACCCCDSQNALVEEGVLSCRSCKLLCQIHRMLWWKKVLSLLPCKCCCCDSE
jgi:hypothetical protein